jgi:hypothetical protein
MLWYLGKETVIFSYYIPVGIAVKRIMAGCSFNRFSPSGSAYSPLTLSLPKIRIALSIWWLIQKACLFPIWFRSQ